MSKDTKQSYVDMQIEAIAETEEVSLEEAREKFLERSEHLTRIDQLKPQEHRWVDRGIVMSCEGGTHPAHRAFKRR